MKVYHSTCHFVKQTSQFPASPRSSNLSFESGNAAFHKFFSRKIYQAATSTPPPITVTPVPTFRHHFSAFQLCFESSPAAFHKFFPRKIYPAATSTPPPITVTPVPTFRHHFSAFQLVLRAATPRFINFSPEKFIQPPPAPHRY